MPSLDVIREVAWIEAVDTSNTVCAVTPWEVLTAPDRWRAVQYADPMHTVVAYRFLAAMWLCAVRDNIGIGDYVERYGDRWWLNDTQYPFGQQSLLTETVDGNDDGNSVLPSLDVTYDKGSPLLWRHETSLDRVTVTAAQATLLTLVVQATGPAGLGRAAVVDGKKSTYRSNPTGPVAGRASAIPYGKDLACVLSSLSRYYPIDAGDTALWERRDDLVTKKTIRRPAGTLEWLTWPTRQVLLEHGINGVTGAVATPGWTPDIDVDHQLAIDPFAMGHPEKKTHLLGATDVNNHTDAVQLPAWIDDLRTPDTGVAVSVIGQSRKLAKVVGVKQQRRWLTPTLPQPLVKDELCQPQLF